MHAHILYEGILQRDDKLCSTSIASVNVPDEQWPAKQEMQVLGNANYLLFNEIMRGAHIMQAQVAIVKIARKNLQVSYLAIKKTQPLKYKIKCDMSLA